MKSFLTLGLTPEWVSLTEKGFFNKKKGNIKLVIMPPVPLEQNEWIRASRTGQPVIQMNLEQEISDSDIVDVQLVLLQSTPHRY